MKSKSCWKEKRKYIRRYEITAGIYNLRYREEQEKKYTAVLNNLEITSKDVVLDVGCGTGMFIQRIANFGGTIIGVDCSKRMLAEFKKDCGRLADIFLICGDADFLPLREKAFDKVFAFTLIQNLPNPVTTVSEILRVANVKSYIVLTSSKKSMTKDRFEELLRKANLSTVKFIDNDELKDYLSICRRSGH